MGRTLPTIVQLIHSEEDAWRSFRRALRKEDQELFDRLWVYCRTHAQAAAMANREIPFETLIMAMLLGLLREISNIEYRISNLTAQHTESSKFEIRNSKSEIPLREISNIEYRISNLTAQHTESSKFEIRNSKSEIPSSE